MTTHCAIDVDFEHHGPPCQWVHPETGVRINCEDMPSELLPASR